MERLTERKVGIVGLKSCWGLCDHPRNGCDCTRIRSALNRLTAYEEICFDNDGKETISIARLRELAQAEKDGRLAVLPCKVGGTVWTNFSVAGDYFKAKDRPYPCEVVFIGLSEQPFIHIKFSNGRVCCVDFDKIGKTIFLTREEAEAALRGAK